MSAFSRELRSFMVVSQSGSIRQAAERLNISAPALSRQIQLLERSYGTPLLVRSAQGIAMTAEGEALRAEAVGWMAADAKVLQRLKRKSEFTGVHLRIGVMEGLVGTLLPALSSRLEALFGSVELDVVVGSTGELIEKSEALELDLVVAFNMPRLSRLIVVDSTEYHLGVVHAPGWGPEGEGPISLAEALDWPLCLPSSALSMHTRLLAEILSVRVNPKVALNSNSISTLLTFLRARQGLSFLTWVDVCADVDAGNLLFRSLQNRRLMETLSISICRGNALGEATGAITQEIKDIIELLGQ